MREESKAMVEPASVGKVRVDLVPGHPSGFHLEKLARGGK